MSETRRRARVIFEVFTTLNESGDGIRPGAVCDYLRDHNDPIGAWEVRGQFSHLVELGLIRLDPDTGIYHGVEGAEWPQDTLSEAG